MHYFSMTFSFTYHNNYRVLDKILGFLILCITYILYLVHVTNLALWLQQINKLLLTYLLTMPCGLLAHCAWPSVTDELVTVLLKPLIYLKGT